VFFQIFTIFAFPPLKRVRGLLRGCIKKGSPERGAGTRSVTEGLFCFPAEKFLSEEETTCQSEENVV